MKLSLVFSLLVLGLSFLLFSGWIFQSKEIVSFDEMNEDSGLEKPLMFKRLDSPLVSLLDQNNEILYGRYSKPCVNPQVITSQSSYWEKHFRLKEWNFFSLTTDRFLFAFAIVDFQYLNGGFIYVFDKQNLIKWESSSVLPKWIGKPFGSSTIAPSSLVGKSSFGSAWGSMSFEYFPNSENWIIEFSASLSQSDHQQLKQFRGTISIDHTSNTTDDLVLVFPLSDNGLSRPAYVHKNAGMLAKATIYEDNQLLTISQPTSCLDWTRSLAKRQTRWLWASMSGYTQQGTRIGINLSRYVYDTINGVSQENAIWYNGQVFIVENPVEFLIPDVDHLLNSPWQFHSRSNSVNQSTTVEFQLTFTPIGSREEHIRAWIVVSDFVQAFGFYSGSISLPGLDPIFIDGLLGVAEKHLAVW